MTVYLTKIHENIVKTCQCVKTVLRTFSSLEPLSVVSHVHIGQTLDELD